MTAIRARQFNSALRYYNWYFPFTLQQTHGAIIAAIMRFGCQVQFVPPIFHYWSNVLFTFASTTG
jgi:hypothetical protein